MVDQGAAKDNLTSLHDHEENIRTESLGIIARRADLTDHLALVQEAMNVIGLSRKSMSITATTN